jgi:hypothetical protein
MKVRRTIAGTPLRVRLTAMCWGALTLLAPVAVSACTSTSSSTTPTVFSPSVTTSPTGSVTASASSGNSPSSGSTVASGTPGVSSSSPAPGTATATATVTRTATAQATSSTSRIPSAAPVTGGGGTAGLQDTLLLGLGAAAILAGAGSIVYRRRLNRDR